MADLREKYRLASELLPLEVNEVVRRHLFVIERDFEDLKELLTALSQSQEGFNWSNVNR